MKFTAFLLLLLFTGATYAQKISAPYYPTSDYWERKSPASFGFDSIQLQSAIQFALQNETKMPRDQELAQIYNFYKEPFSDAVGPFAERKAPSGIIIHKGYIIAEWGDVYFPEQTNSITKSFLSSVVGIAVDRGLIKNIQDKVYSYLPPIEPFDPNPNRPAEEIGKPQMLFPFLTNHNKKISWDHLLRQTSDWEGTLWGKPDWADRPNDKPLEWKDRPRHEPGSVFKYNDTRVNALALATTAVFHRPLPEVLRESIMDPIGASNTWHWTGYRNSWIVMDGKRIQSVSGGGHFGGGLFISAIDMARFGLLTQRKGKWNQRQILSEKWIDLSTTPTTANPGYGFMNYFLNTNKKMLPSAPASAFTHIGNGTNMIYVDRENDLIIVARWIENNAMDGLVDRILRAKSH